MIRVFVFIALLSVLPMVVVVGITRTLRSVHAQEPTKSWLIYEDTSAGFRVTKIQDGSCSLYVASPTENGKNGTAVPAIATGQGCK